MRTDNVSIPLTAIILTYNEAYNIKPCLECLAPVADIVIVDSESSDDTLKVAKKLCPDARIFTHAFTDFGDQRNWALDHTAPKHEWVLFVDADEFCTCHFLDEVSRFLASPGEHVGGFIAGRNYFLGRWLKHATMYPSFQLRLLKRGEVRYRKEGHGQREVTQGPLHYFKEGWRHEGFSKGLHQWIARHNSYSSEEVELILRLRQEPLSWSELFSSDAIVRRRALKRLGARMPFRPLTRFLYTYLWRRGFLDGYPGLLFCALRVAHDVHIVAKLSERKHMGKTDQPSRMNGWIL